MQMAWMRKGICKETTKKHQQIRILKQQKIRKTFKMIETIDQ